MKLNKPTTSAMRLWEEVQTEPSRPASFGTILELRASQGAIEENFRELKEGSLDTNHSIMLADKYLETWFHRIWQKANELVDNNIELLLNNNIDPTEFLISFGNTYGKCKNIIKEKSDALSVEINIAVPDKNFIAGIASELVAGFEAANMDEIAKADALRIIVTKCGFEHLLTPAQTAIDFPASPPDGEFYDRRANKSEKAPEFIGRVYGRWLTGEFTRADLRKIDEKAEMALRNWERTHGRADLNLPTLKEKNDGLLAASGDVVSPDMKRALEAGRVRQNRARKGITQKS